MPDLQQRFDRLAGELAHTPGAAPADLRRRGDRRTRRQVVGASLAVVAILGAGTAVAVASSRSDAGPPVVATVPRPSPTPVGTPAPTPTPSPTPATTRHQQTVRVGSIVLDVPDGWTVGRSSFDEACIAPVKPRPAALDCPGLHVYYGWNGYLPGNEATNFTADHPGWYDATDEHPCPVGGSATNGIASNGASDPRQLRPVGDRQAYYYVWHARCFQNAYTFTPRAWYLPVSKLLLIDRTGYPDVDPIVRNARFDDGTWKTAYLDGHSADGATLNVDEVTWLSGDAALAYAHAHGQSDVPNDYLIVNDSRATIPERLADVVVVYGSFRLPVPARDPSQPQVRVTRERLLQYVADRGNWSTPFHVHVTAAGVIDEIDEQYVP